MRLHNAFIWVLLIAVLMSPVSVLSAQPEGVSPFKIAFSDFPPYSIEKGVEFSAYRSGECVYPKHNGYGIDPDFFMSALEHAGIEYQLLFYPFARVQFMLKNDSVDATAGIFYDEQEGRPKYHYILYDLGGATLFYAKKELAAMITELEQLKSLRFGMLRKESFHNDLLNMSIYEKKTIKPTLLANNYKQLFKVLDAGRVDVIAVNNVVGEYLMKTEDVKGVAASPLRLAYGKDPIADGIYIGLRRSLPVELYERLKTSVDTLVKQGVFRCVQAKYGVDSNY